MRLITIGFSHFCEKARWALDHHRVDYSEEAHAPFFHVRAVKRAGGKRATPVLVTEEGVLNGSTAILPWLEGQAGRPTLFGANQEETAEIEAIAKPFDERLGPAARRSVYYHLLQHPDLAKSIFRSAAQPGQHWKINAAFPALRWAMRRMMRIDAAGFARSEAVIEEILADVDARLADGRQYLCLDRFTAADLTFAALAAPLVKPTGYGWTLPPLDQYPPPAIEKIHATRARPAGRFIQRIYEQHRQQS